MFLGVTLGQKLCSQDCAPEYEFQNVIFRTLQSPVDYVRVCVFEKVGR